MTKILAASVAALFALAVAISVSAQDQKPPSGVYRMDPNHASLFWHVRHLGLSQYTARMKTFDIQLELDTDNLANSKVSATIDPRSVITGYPGKEDFDGQIAADPRLLDADGFPTITFVSTEVRPTGDKTAQVTGDLTLRGVTLPVTLEVELIGAVPQHPFTKKAAVGFRATGKLDRIAFGMDFLAPLVVAPEVEVTVNAEFLAQ